MLLNLTSLPSDPQFKLHYFADHIELLALAQDEDGISRSEITRRFEFKEKLKTNIFELIKYRKETFSEKYPFIVDRDSIRLKENLDDLQRVYLFLLLCSCSSKVENSDRIRTDFELLCWHAFKNHLPEQAICHIIGKSGLDYDRYKGHITDKLKLLAEDLRVKIKFEDDWFASNDTGDGGLDLVAWVPFKDDPLYHYIQLFFCQCATGRDWLQKQSEPANAGNYFELKNDFTTAMFIPYDARKSDGLFVDQLKITIPLILDRLRIINLLGDGSSIRELPSNETHVTASIDFIEDFI